MNELIRCPKCGEMKPREDYYGVRKRSGWCKVCSRAKSAAYYAANKERQKAKHREWVAANKERVAAHKAKSAYGIPLDEYEQLMHEGKCAICGNTERLRIDHCHVSERVRGVLCDSCNKGLGFFRDDPARLRAAIRYLDPMNVADRREFAEAVLIDHDPASPDGKVLIAVPDNDDWFDVCIQLRDHNFFLTDDHCKAAASLIEAVLRARGEWPYQRKEAPDV